MLGSRKINIWFKVWGEIYVSVLTLFFLEMIMGRSKMSKEEIRKALLEAEIKNAKENKASKVTTLPNSMINANKIDLTELRSSIYLKKCIIDILDKNIYSLVDKLNSTIQIHDYFKESYCEGLIDMDFDEFLELDHSTEEAIKITEKDLNKKILKVNDLDEELYGLEMSLGLIEDRIKNKDIEEETIFDRYVRAAMDLL